MLPVIAFHGRVDASCVSGHRDAMLAMIAGGQTRFLIDLAETTFLDSAGMAALVSVLKRSRLAGGDIGVVEPRDPGVRRILHLTRLDLVLNLQPSREAATLVVQPLSIPALSAGTLPPFQSR